MKLGTILISYLQAIASWCDEWEMSLNFAKCVFTQFTTNSTNVPIFSRQFLLGTGTNIKIS